MAFLQKYFYIFKSTWQEYMAYRANFFLEILGGAAVSGAILFLWVNVYKNYSSGAIGGYTLAEMITYIIGAGLIFSFIFTTSQGDEIDDDINEGFLSNYLLKPLNVNFYWLTRDIARKILTGFLGIAAFGTIIIFTSKYLAGPASSAMLVFALSAVVFGALVHFFLFYLTSIISFWLGRTWGFRFVIRVILEIASGAIIPLSFLPGIWKNIFEFLPLKFIAYFPMQIYLGKITTTEILSGFGWGILWLAIFAGLSYYFWKKGIRHYTAVGS